MTNVFELPETYPASELGITLRLSEDDLQKVLADARKAVAPLIAHESDTLVPENVMNFLMR